MRAHFKYMVKGYSGKIDGLVFYYNSKLGRTMARKLVKPTLTAQNHKYGTVTKNLTNLNLSEGYKQDLAHYVTQYAKAKIKGKRIICSWYNLYIMLMWAMARQLDIDLITLTREEIEAKDLPCRTVKQAVEAGLIAPIQGYQILTNQM